MATSKKTLDEINKIQMKILDYVGRKQNRCATLPVYNRQEANTLSQCLKRRNSDLSVEKNIYGDNYFLSISW